MKIAFLVIEFPKLSETFILNQIVGLIENGHEVTIFSLHRSEEQKLHPDVKNHDLLKITQYIDIPVATFERILKAIGLVILNFHKNPLKILNSLNVIKFGRDALYLRLFYTLINFLDNNFDIVHCHFGSNGLLGVHLKQIGMPGKFITTFHGYDVHSYIRTKEKTIYKALFKNGDCFTANTNFTKQKIVELGCPEEKIVILPVGVDLSKFQFHERRIPRADEPVIMLTVGRLIEKKGHKYALEALKQTALNHKTISYIIAGEGPLRDNLKSQVNELGLEHNVKFLGAVDQNEALSLYRKAHFFVLPCVTASDGDTEGQALVLQEAQATGLPVISTFHNGIPEGVLNGKSGFLVPEKDVDALSDRITYLIKNPDRWSSFGYAGRKYVEEKYDINKLNSELINIYQNLIS
jgi:colanic acid/amylovoran biosynthesis glycosyltransferase